MHAFMQHVANLQTNSVLQHGHSKELMMSDMKLPAGIWSVFDD